MLYNKNSKIIVVGGNAAGPSAAAKAKRTNPDAEVIMFEAEEYISTGTCEMPYVIAGDIESYEKIVFFDEESFKEKKGVKVYTKHRVENIDRRNKSITVLDNVGGRKYNFEYDKLILATGATCKRLPQITPFPDNMFTLKTVANLKHIEEYIDEHKPERALVIGGGYIGIEAAEGLLRRGLDVTVIEQADTPMNTADNEVRELVKEEIEKNGVNFIGGATDVEFIVKDNKLKSIKHESRLMNFDLVISAIGFKPNNTLAVAAKLDVGKFGGIKVDNKLKTSDPHIYAAGDNIEVINKVTGKPDYFPLATIAHQTGHIAGENAAGGNAVAPQVVKNIAVKIFDKVLVSVGLTEDEVKQHGYNYKSIYKVANNIIPVMPGSKKVFGKVLYESGSRKILGASFFGQHETIGFGDIISMMIRSKLTVDVLGEVDYNYTPPYSPFINLLSILGRKAE